MPKCSILSFYLFFLFIFLYFSVLALTYAKAFHFIFTQMFLPSKLVFTVSFSLFPIFYVDFPQKFRLKQFISYCSPIMSLFEGLLLGKVARDCPYLSPLSVQQCNWKHRLVRPPFSSVCVLSDCRKYLSLRLFLFLHSLFKNFWCLPFLTKSVQNDLLLSVLLWESNTFLSPSSMLHL